MKRILALIMLLALAVPMFVACDEATEASSEAGESSATESKEEIPMNPDTNAPKVWTEEYADEANGFKDASEVYKLQAFSNGIASEEYAKLPSGDTRYIFEGKDKSRAVVLPEGYALTLPSANITADFSLGALRSKFKGDGYMLTVSYEDQNPYGANEKGWNIYLTEWVERYLVDNNFLMENSIRRTRQAGVTEDLLEGYVVHYYDMQINVATKMEYDCYSIALIRPKAHYKYFYMLVLKSGDPMYEQMDEIVKSFKEIQKKGTSVNSVGAYELKIPEHWNEETKAYYNKLLTQNTVDMGMFYQKNDPVYVDWFYQSIESELDVFMTYLHCGWYGKDYTRSELDMNLINSQAGGNGFNGKPVLELTYQFTTTNNGLGGYTPMYDICRGRLDLEFRQLAKEIKAYGKPVLFRLNNEMNTDWTSYCGMQTMNDPDIFIDTWRRMYNIFIEEGVDNCIWIWNPIATSCPYSNWGDQLNYWPGSDYVQMLGLTYYQMNNDDKIESFAEMYAELYKKNTPWFDNFPAILGEFACGAGAEVIYNYDLQKYVPVEDLETKKQWQAEWITAMFDCFMKKNEPGYEWCKNITVATWFSANDYTTVDGVEKIYNYLKLDNGVPNSIEAFKEGYKKLREARETVEAE